MHGLDHGPDPEEHPSEGRRDVLAGQELPPAGHQEERQDRNVDIPGWSLIMALAKKVILSQMRSPAVKQDWVVELRLARLALDPNNSPGWDILEQANQTEIKTQQNPILKVK